MPGLRLPGGRWVFAPTLWPSLAAAFFFALTLSLGNWQSGRAAEKRAQQAAIDAALAEPPVVLRPGMRDARGVLDRRVELAGVFDARHTIYIDNRVQQGRAGYHVLTPLALAGGSVHVLVNRGWVAVGASRAVLPQPPVPQGTVRIAGRAVSPESRYVELGNAEPAGSVWQNLDFARYARETGLDLLPVLVLQTSDSGDGLVRDWDRPGERVIVHQSYALQWYALAGTLAVLWVALNLHRIPVTEARP